MQTDGQRILDFIEACSQMGIWVSVDIEYGFIGARMRLQMDMPVDLFVRMSEGEPVIKRKDRLDFYSNPVKIEGEGGGVGGGSLLSLPEPKTE